MANSPSPALMLLPLIVFSHLGVILSDGLKAGGSIELATGSPSLNINNDDSNSLEQLIEMRLNESQSASVQGRQSEELLSRKRRYLVFPEGSSFQIGKLVTPKRQWQKHETNSNGVAKVK